MMRGQGIAILLSGLFLISVLPFSPSVTEPIQQNDWGTVDGISEEQIMALEGLPESVKVSGRTGNSTSTWAWAVKAGSSDEDYGNGIAVDSAGSAYVTGYFQGTAAFGSTSLTSSGERDIFVAKLSSSGSWLWAVKAGGSGLDSGDAIAVDSSGNSYVTGYFESDNATFGSTSLSKGCMFGGGHAFVAKLSSSGTWLWSSQTNGGLFSCTQRGLGIAVDSVGSAYVTGFFDEIANFGDLDQLESPSEEVFVAKLSSNGSWLWAVKAGGSIGDSGYAIAYDSSGGVYVTGYFESDNATFGSTSLTSSGGKDIFVAKLSSSGSWLWAVKAGGSGLDSGDAIAVDSSGNSYVTGYFGGTAAFGSTSLTSSGANDIFISKLSSSGSWLWAVKAGGTSIDYARGIAIDSLGNSYVAGHFDGVATFGSASLTHSGDYDIFIAVHQDQDMDGVSNSNDNCPDGAVNWISDSSTDYDTDGCRDVDEDDDDDNDGITDALDSCQKGALGWNPDSSTDYDTDGCRDVDEDDDDDNDGIIDLSDSCKKGILDWTSISSTDYDSDGCQDSGEDDDDDNDGIIDVSDSCQKGALGWTPESSTDYDTDGCRDVDEDDDDDNDGILDSSDSCQKGSLDWTQDSSTDYDSDGCRDVDEDDDDDNDGIMDTNDACQKGNSGWTPDSSTDYDTDGCEDLGEDDDDDNDGITDASDSCQKGSLDWTSISSTDYDTDGCRDVDEDDDDDNDGIMDSNDACQKGDLAWTSDSSTDYDTDGCRDVDEDDDDDNDGVMDWEDNCKSGESNWLSITVNDYDSDGCQDNSEDLDDDNDGVDDNSDNCPTGSMDWISDKNLDYDLDGCRNSDEDLDDDNDGVDDNSDNCPIGSMDWISDKNLDYDLDGCRDSDEDLDDDNDGILDNLDNCQKGSLYWSSGSVTDIDGDGCRDSDEDDDYENQESNNKQSSSEDLSFIDRLSEGDLDAIGIILAIILPIVGLSISVMLRKRKIGLVNSITLKVNSADSTEELRQIGLEIDGIMANDKISQVQYQSLKNKIQSKQIEFSPVITGNIASANSVESSYNSEIGEQSVTMQDSVIGGDSFVGSTKIENQVYNDPEAIAKAAIEAFRMGAESKAPISNEFVAQFTDVNGYEWYTSDDGSKFYRQAGTEQDWTLHKTD